MQTVSANFTAAAIATTRKPKGKIEITWTDPYVGDAMTIISSSDHRITWNNQVADLLVTTPHKYAILDGTFMLDGTYYAAPSTTAEAADNQFGWYTLEVSGTGGFFEGSPEISVNFAARAVLGLMVVGEPTLGQYPVDFNLYVYEGLTVVYSETFVNNTDVEFNIDISSHEIYAATRIRLVIIRWSVANTVAKVVEFFSTVIDTIDGDDIVSMNILEEREIRDGSLPVGNISCNELDLELQNISITRGGITYTDPFSPGNTDSYLQNFLLPMRKIRAWLGFELSDGTSEYVPVGTFWTGEWSTTDDKFSVTVSARDRMEILRRATFVCDTIFVNQSLYAIADYVLNYARVNLPLLDLTWEIDDEFNDLIIPYAWFEKKSYMEVIREIAEAGIGQAYMSKNDVLILEGYSVNHPISTDLSITKDNYFSKSQPSNYADLANYIEVETQPLSPATEETQIYESPGAITIGANETQTGVEIQYNELPVSGAVAELFDTTGGITVSITGATYYPWGAVLTIVESSGNAGTYKIRVNGTTYSVLNSEVVIEQDADSIEQNGKKVYKFPNNCLVQSHAVAETIAEQLLASYKDARKDIRLNWRGTPALELGDVIHVPEYQRGSVNNYGDFIVYKQSIKFDGGLSCDIEARRVEIPA